MQVPGAGTRSLKVRVTARTAGVVSRLCFLAGFGQSRARCPGWPQFQQFPSSGERAGLAMELLEALVFFAGDRPLFPVFGVSFVRVADVLLFRFR